MADYVLYLIGALNFIAVIYLVIRINNIKGNDRLEKETALMVKSQERLERVLREEIATNREENFRNSKRDRDEASANLRLFGDNLITQMKVVADLQKNQLEAFSNHLSKLTEINEQGLNRMREILEQKLKDIQTDNNQKLDQMRATVDEKLHNTLEQRLGESFKSISERLEALYRQLGEVQSLTSGVNDLKRALTNVKTRGTWGEIQLGNIMEQILTPEQYSTNVATKRGSNDRVEFAVKLPGQGDSPAKCVWLPIDAKFPQEDYQRLLDAQEQGNKSLAEEYAKQLELRIKTEAKSIKEKYIDPPDTTDFGIMFLPTESLYAEIIKRPGLWDVLQREYRVVITGPTTLAALLNSLQMGFRTLAIEKRSSEVWSLLGVVKTEFSKFGDILEKTQKKLQEASNTIDTAARKSRNIERKLRNVQELPVEDEIQLLDQAEEYEDESAATS